MEYKKIGSYSEDDVKFLLKDLSDIDLEGNIAEREKKVQQGEHYSESLPVENPPKDEYMSLFYQLLAEYKKKIAFLVSVLGEKIIGKNGSKIVLVSLARGGTPVGILLKRYFQWKYELNIPHYSISIFRGKGFDENAIRYIIENHPYEKIQFVDGWTGKGAISLELTQSCQEFFKKYGQRLDDSLAVLADPGRTTSLFATREDYLIPSACLNSTVSGLISRTVFHPQWIGPTDFHGAKYYRHFSHLDVSNKYVDTISDQFSFVQDEVRRFFEDNQENNSITFSGMETVRKICREFSIDNINFVKPGVGETTRVLLRRIPWKVLIKDKNHPFVQHLLLLCQEKNVPIEYYPVMEYEACGLIKKLH